MPCFLSRPKTVVPGPFDCAQGRLLAGGPLKPVFGLSGDLCENEFEFDVKPANGFQKFPTQRKPRCVGHPPDSMSNVGGHL